MEDQFKARITVQSVSCGANHTAFVTTVGTVYCCGHNQHGQCGTGDSGEYKRKPTLVQSNSIKGWFTKRFIQAACGGEHTLLLADDGLAFAFGNNTNGQLGDGTGKPTNLPVVVKETKSLTKVCGVRCGLVLCVGGLSVDGLGVSA